MLALVGFAAAFAAAGGRRGPAASAVRGVRLSPGYRRGHGHPPDRWQRLGWALPWLLFLAFPVADLVSTRGRLAVRVAPAALVVFTAAYLAVFSRMFQPAPAVGDVRELLVVAVLGVALAVWLGPAWAGLLIYVSVAAAGSLPDAGCGRRCVGAAAVCGDRRRRRTGCSPTCSSCR